MGEQRLIGVTQHFRVSIDTDLGDLPALIVLDNCENDFAVIQEYFGSIQPLLLPIEVYIVDQEGASWNPRLGPKAMTCGTKGRDQMELPWFPSFLTAVELVEFFAVAQVGGINGLGWNPGRSAGEGLSRVIGDSLYGGASVHSPVVIQWFGDGSSANQPDFVNNNSTDLDDVAVGCAVLFLNYLRFVLNIAWNSIVTLGGTANVNFKLILRDVYSFNTDVDEDPFPQFQSYVNSIPFFPSRLQFGDNPFWHATGDPSDLGY
jgi:hypothetical protein